MISFLLFLSFFLVFSSFLSATVSLSGVNSVPVLLNYLCHPTHLSSTPNVYKKIMNALSLSSDDPTDHIRYISLYLTDFSEDLDSIVYMDSTSSNIPFQTYFSNGLFEITLDSSLISTISVDSWSELLNNFYYKLNLNNNQIGLCDLKDSFGKSVYEKSFFLYVYLEGQPDSNRLEREIQIVLKNSLIVFTEIEPIKITNKATYITIDLPMNSYDKERMNFIAAPADSLVEEVKNT